ncbi:unnamed protein product [Soboliphyme baturini]|uniref:AMP-binding domain-containing protein n=1 Tax=Soboliphyme baturini TaxID=241478 RepID=A0A183IQ37_9BILA|nr:unnamed protein product [Soboliphyme baturini]
MSGKCAKNMYVYKSLSKTENFGNLLPLAYVMFTSGTTGPLKIVKVPHSCILPNICDFRELFQMSSKDRVFLSSPLSFDPSIIEIFLALSTGACLTTPSLLTSFSDDVITNQILGSESRLRVLALGGERFPVHIFRKLTGISIKPAVYNLYGITEVSCWATCYKFDPGKELRSV